MIIIDNLINLLRLSVFGETVVIQPMSPWKWQQLMDMSARYGLNGLVANAVDVHHVDLHLNVPQRLFPLSGTQKDYEHALEMELTIGDIDYLNSQLTTRSQSSLTLPSSQLLTRWRQKRLDKIRKEEEMDVEPSIDTLRLMDIIVANVCAIEQNGISLLYVLSLGHYLRNQGDRVDFVKLERWIGRLHLQTTVSMLASILIDTFEFSKDELPFLTKHYKKAAPMLYGQMLREKRESRISYSTSMMKYDGWGFVSYWTTLIHDSLLKIEE